MKSSIRFVVLAVIALLFSSCQERVQPIYNPSNVSIPASLAVTSLEEIGTIIKQAGARENWKMTDTEPGEIKSVLNIRAHQATVRVDYSLISYSITYVSSINLKDVGYGIHKNYNSWIRDLESAINVDLLKRAQTIKNQSLSSDDKAMLEAWNQAKKSDNPLVLQEFMDMYESGPFASAAQDRLNLLAQQRVSGVKRYDPTGLWQVVVTYKGGNGNSSWCGGARTWRFRLDLARGKISRTVYDTRYGLYITGENSEDYVYLQFDYPTGGGQWKWTERFVLDRNEKRMTLSSAGGAPSGCTGTLGVYMKKIDALGDTSGTSNTARISKKFDPTGLWQVTADYKRGSGNLSNCPRSNRWDFTLDFRRGKIAETYWSGHDPLYVTGENSDDFVDLKFNIGLYGGQWKWTERFKLDNANKNLTAKAEGVCPGTMKLYMKKMDTIGSAIDTPNVTKHAANLDPAEQWQVNAVYRGHNGNAAYCPNGAEWRFMLEITDQKQTKEIWSGRHPLYVTSEKRNKRIDMKVDLPRGGNDWQWVEPFKLDGKGAQFIAEATGYGGAYGGCSGKLHISMNKQN